MPWNEPGGNQQDPWTGKKRPSGKSEIEEIISKLTEKLGGLFGSGGDGNSPDNRDGNKGIIILLILLFIGWLLSGFYTVDARQQALVLRFGAYQETTQAGLHWHLPYPIETTEAVDVEQNRSAQDRSTMLTKDENIVDIAVSVQYKVRDAEAFSFNVKDVDSATDPNEGTLYQVMRSSTREVIGRNTMDFILKEGREQIAIETQALMQQVLDAYKTGLQVIKVNMTYAEAPAEVKDAFDDANRAREDFTRFKNEADTYSKKVVPDARGRSARMQEEANAYRQESIDRAQGDAARFSQLVAEYHKAPAVTRERLYLETMESVMAGSRKVLIDSKGNNMIYLPLDQLSGQQASAASNAAAVAAANVKATQNVPSTASPSNSPPAQSGNTSTNTEAGNPRQSPNDTSSIREGR
jgi:membrane protease subunit HflK